MPLRIDPCRNAFEDFKVSEKVTLLSAIITHLSLLLLLFFLSCPISVVLYSSPTLSPLCESSYLQLPPLCKAVDGQSGKTWARRWNSRKGQRRGEAREEEREEVREGAYFFTVVAILARMTRADYWEHFCWIRMMKGEECSKEKKAMESGRRLASV